MTVFGSTGRGVGSDDRGLLATVAQLAPTIPTPVYGLISATADGSTGQTYTLNASWAGVQWYRMQLAKPNALTKINGATTLSYVAQAADEGYRLVAVGTDAGVTKASKAFHVVLPPPVLLDPTNSATGWVSANGAVVDLDSGKLRVKGTGTVNAQATKADIGSYDSSTFGTIAALIDTGLDAGRPGGATVTIRKSGADQASLNFGTLYETPTPVAMGKLWGALHVSENASLASSGGSTIGVKLMTSTVIPFDKSSNLGPLLGKAGGRATVNLNFDDNKVTQYSFGFKQIMQPLDLVADINNVKTTAGSSSALNLPKLQEMYAAGWDIGLDSTDNDDLTASYGTLALAGESWQRGKDYVVANGLTRGNEHGCWTGGQTEVFVNQLPTDRILVTAATSDGSTTVNLGGTISRYPTAVAIRVGMRVVGLNVPDSPKTTVVAVNSDTQVVLSASIPAQTKPMYFVDDAPEFYTMKAPAYYRDVLGMKTMRTTRADGGILTRFGFGDRGIVFPGNALHALTFDQFKAVIDRVILLGLTIQFYTHGIIPGGGGVESDETIFTQQMQYLAQKRDEGLLDVMTRSQIWARDGNATVPTGLQPPPTVFPAGVRFVGATSDNTSPALPSGVQAGDLLLAFAYRDGNTTVPTLPAGWTSLSTVGANSSAYVLAYKLAASASETIGTFTGATNTVVQAYRNVSASSPIGNVSPAATGASGNLSVPAASWSLQSAGTSWVAYFGGSRSAGGDLDTSANRIGHTNATSGSDVGGNDTYGPVSTLTNLPLGGSGGQTWYAVAVEIKA